MILKNTAGQGIYLYNWNQASGSPQTGDAANITGSISKDGAAGAATATVNPTEIGGGVYWQPLSQAETNANEIALYWSSTTSGTVINPVIISTAVADTSGFLKVDVEDWRGSLANALVLGNVPADAQGINSVSTSAVAAVSTIIGTTQPLNFTGTGGTSLVRADTIDVGGVPQTGGDLYAAITASVVTGAPLNQNAASTTLTTGTETGGVGNTYSLDGVFNSWTQAGGTIDGYYQFDISGTPGGTATSVSFDGYLTGNSNSIYVYYYNWSGAVWSQIGTIAGQSGAAVGSSTYDLPPAATGTGANAGQVRVRFQRTGLATGGGGGVLNVDRLLMGFAQILSPPANWATERISGTGYVSIDMTEVVSLSNTTNTVGDCLNAARAQGFGKWVISGTTLSLYAPDGSTVIRSFTLDSATAPTQRT